MAVGDVAEHPLAYARQTLLNEFLAWRRLRSSREIVDDEVTQDVALVADAAGRLAERDVLWRLLGQLSPRGRAVLVLRYYEQLSDDEIAALIGARPATVRSIAARSLAVLRAHPMLADVFEEA